MLRPSSRLSPSSSYNRDQRFRNRIGIGYVAQLGVLLYTIAENNMEIEKHERSYSIHSRCHSNFDLSLFFLAPVYDVTVNKQGLFFSWYCNQQYILNTIFNYYNKKQYDSCQVLCIHSLFLAVLMMSQLTRDVIVTATCILLRLPFWNHWQWLIHKRRDSSVDGRYHARLIVWQISWCHNRQALSWLFQSIICVSCM